MRAATEGHLPPVMPQGNLVEVLGREVRKGSPGELMVESSPSRQRWPPCKTSKEMSDEAADAAALTYLFTTVARAEVNEAHAMSGSARNVTCKAHAIIPSSRNLQEQDRVHHRQGCDGVGSLSPATILLRFRHGDPFFQLGLQRPLDGRP